MPIRAPISRRRSTSAERPALALLLSLACGVGGATAAANDDPVFEPYAAQVLADLQFKVPPDWAASGGPWRRFRIQVTFTIEGQPPLPVWAQGESVILITGSMSRGH